jgi:hypothetical protein
MAKKLRKEPVEHDGIEMHPFPYSAEGSARAIEWAEAASSLTHEETNIAIAELVAGIAAIEDDEDRAVIASEVIQAVLGNNRTIKKAINKELQKHRNSPAVGYS